jgi:hypothetical protein
VGNLIWLNDEVNYITNQDNGMTIF